MEREEDNEQQQEVTEAPQSAGSPVEENLTENTGEVKIRSRP